MVPSRNMSQLVIYEAATRHIYVDFVFGAKLGFVGFWPHFDSFCRSAGHVLSGKST